MSKTAIILIGYQNDYFSKNGILYSVIEESSVTSGVLENTIKVINSIKNENVLIISTPIIFTSDYSELTEPVGILKTIKEVGAFKDGKFGSETIDEIKEFKDRIIEVPGKLGLNAFMNTNLEEILKNNGITHVALAGAVCSICIDSTGRYAFEKGFEVSMISDCISGRSVFEQQFYCENIFPLYASVLNSESFIKKQASIINTQ